jgi:hypothetical protein
MVVLGAVVVRGERVGGARWAGVDGVEALERKRERVGLDGTRTGSSAAG